LLNNPTVAPGATEYPVDPILEQQLPVVDFRRPWMALPGGREARRCMMRVTRFANESMRLNAL
jgi:hypothetical protein